MDWLWILAAIFTGWAVLRVIGAERQRRMQELMIQFGFQQPDSPARGQKSTSPVAPPAAAPVRSKAAR
jgi:hypothetical protein